MCTVWAALFLFLSPFPFRYRFAALLRTPPPSPLTHPSLLSICPFPRLSTTFPFSSLPPSLPPAAPLRSSFPALRLRLSFFRPPRPFSLVISSSFALSIFLLLLSPSPPIFPLPYACLLSFFRSSYYHRLSSLLTPSSRASRSIFLPFVPLYIPPPPP